MLLRQKKGKTYLLNKSRIIDDKNILSKCLEIQARMNEEFK